MNPRNRPGKGSATGRNRKPKNTVTTKSGNTLKINRSLSDRAKARKEAKAAERASYLATLPKNKFKRALYRLEPRRLARYWFSREGGIMALKLVGVSIVLGFFLVIGMFAYFRKDLPKIKDISGDRLGGNITYYDRTGQTVLFQDYDAVKRLPVTDDNIADYMKQATVAIEDKDFYKHGAFDVRGLTRAAYNDAKGGGTVQGGSTITQQLVKLNQDWTSNRTVTRKVKELILAVELEREYSKKDILTGYLNIAPYGGVEYGVESAAQDYFHTSAKHLTLAQASMLAAIPQSPSYYSPYAAAKYNNAVTTDTFSQEALIGRQHYILDQMTKQGFVTSKQASEAKQVDVLAQVQARPDNKYAGIKAPYFVLSAKQQLEQTYGASTVKRGGWKVITSLNMDLQNKAEELVAKNVKNITRYGADEEAMVNEDVQTGEIVSQVGGVDFNREGYGQNNYAAGIKIPPGSSFKPYDYATLINNNNNVGAGSVFYDTQGVLPGYPCTNKQLPKNGGNCLEDYDFKYPGAITLRYALGGSRNVPAVKAMLSAVPNDNSSGHVKSINKVISTASAMMYNTYNDSKNKSSYNCYADEALSQTNQCYGASAIGDGAFLHLDDHVNGLSTLARLGKAIPRTYILKITDAANKDVKLPTHEAKQVIKPDAAYIVNDMASDPNASYLPSAYKFQRYNGWKFAVKTGTTNDGYDGLMTSWSTKYATVSWVGNHTRHVTLTTSMEALTEPLTRGWMEYAHQNEKAVNWEAPTGLKTSAAYIVRNHIGLGSVEPSPTNDLYPSWYVGGGNTKSTSATIDKVSNKVATSCTPAAAKETVGNSNVASWNIDIFNGGKQNIGTSSSSSTSSGSNATDDVHNCNDSPPTVSLSAPDNCTTSCTITATITQGTHPLNDSQYANFPGKIDFTLDGQNIHSENISNSPSTVSFTYTPSGSGSGQLVATASDSVLYTGSDSRNITYSAPTPLSLNATNGNHAISFSWTGGTGAVTAFANAFSCTGATGCQITLPNGTYSTYARDASGAQTTPASVTVN